MGCSLVESAFFRVLRHKADDWSCAETLPLRKIASVIAVTKSEINNQFILTVFSTSFILRPKVSFNKREVIALQVNFACQFGLIDVTLHLRSPLHCRASFATFGLIMSGSGALSNVHNSSMLLVINMAVGGGHMQGPNDGGQGGAIPRAPNHYGGAEKSQQCHMYFLQYSIFASERPQVRTWGRKICFLPRAPSNLVTSLDTWVMPRPHKKLLCYHAAYTGQQRSPALRSCIGPRTC